jgi:hypothetical protein
MDLHTVLAAAAILGGFVSSSEPVSAFYGCEVEMIAGTNAYQFVDPTCPATATYDQTDYITVAILDPETGEKIGEQDVALNNR